MEHPSTIRNRERAWSRLIDTLSTTLDEMAPGQCLIVADRDSNRFVQFSCEKRGEMMMEATSNQYIQPYTRLLTMSDFALLRKLGWSEPTVRAPETYADEPRAGSPNFWVHTVGCTAWRPLAQQALDTLRDVYRIDHPRQLEYHAFTEDREIYLPMLGLHRHQPVEPPQMLNAEELFGWDEEEPLR